jgi:predicted membrane metal-binding protein
MTVLRTALAELIGMFIDDGRLALTLVALIAIVTLLVKLAGIGGLAGGLLLLAGAIGLLIESVYRDARRKKATD